MQASSVEMKDGPSQPSSYRPRRSTTSAGFGWTKTSTASQRRHACTARYSSRRCCALRLQLSCRTARSKLEPFRPAPLSTPDLTQFQLPNKRVFGRRLLNSYFILILEKGYGQYGRQGQPNCLLCSFPLWVRTIGGWEWTRSGPVYHSGRSPGCHILLFGPWGRS